MSAPTPTTTDSEIRSAWQARSAPFTAEVEAIADWDAASPCEGWSARDVLAHVLDTERDFLAEHGLLEPPAAPALSPEQDPAAVWGAHEQDVASLLGDPEIAQRSYDGVFGPTTIGATMTSFYGFDLIVHRWDLARSQGRETTLSGEELSTVGTAVEGWGEHAYAPGIFARPVPVPEGADERVRVLALTGRRA